MFIAWWDCYWVLHSCWNTLINITRSHKGPTWHFWDCLDHARWGGGYFPTPDIAYYLNYSLSANMKKQPLTLTTNKLKRNWAQKFLFFGVIYIKYGVKNHLFSGSKLSLVRITSNIHQPISDILKDLKRVFAVEATRCYLDYWQFWP